MLSLRRLSAISLALIALLLLLVLQHADAASSTHTNNWAVIVSTSRYWFNYRHVSNALAIYHTVRALGIPDSQILLMLPDEYACSPRNSFPGSIWVDRDAADLYSSDVEVDYRGSDVTVQSFLRLLTGRHSSAATSRTQRLLTDADSNILIYMSGHGGNNFLKFQDHEELNSQDLRDSFQQMHAQRRYRSILFLLDTCQASTLFQELNPTDCPNVISIGSSKLGQNSYSMGHMTDVGVSPVDRFTFHTLKYFEKNRIIHRGDTSITGEHRAHKGGGGQQQQQQHTSGLATKKTVQDLFDSYTFSNLRSDVEYRTDLLQAPVIAHDTPPHTSPLSQLPLTDYFGALTHMQASERAYPLDEHTAAHTADANEQGVGFAAAASSSAAASPAPLHSGDLTAAHPGATASKRVVPEVVPVGFEATTACWSLLAGGAAALALASAVADRSQH